MCNIQINPEVCERLKKIFLDRFKMDLSDCNEEILGGSLGN